jgi:hypothetical protein
VYIENVNGVEDDYYVGEYKNGQFNGYGRLFTGRTEQSGIWENGVLVKEIPYEKSTSSGSSSSSGSYDWDSFPSAMDSTQGIIDNNNRIESNLDHFREQLQKGNDSWQAGQASKYD